MSSQRPNVHRRSVERRSVRRLSRGDQNPKFVLALDFGFVRDYTALVLVERVNCPDDPLMRTNAAEDRVQYHVRDIKRFPLGTQTPQIIENICQRMTLRSLAGRTSLIVDATGAGIPIVQEMRQRGLRPVPITITGGGRMKGFSVPKRDLVSRLLLLLQQHRLRISSRLPLRLELKEEFNNFNVKFTANGKPTYSASSAAHDDIIMALCLAVHFFEGRRGVPRVHATVISSQVARSSVRLDLEYSLQDRMLSRWLEL
jgi:hypothetical protein